MRFNWYLGKISRKKSSHVIFLAIGDLVKTDSLKTIFNLRWIKGKISVLFLPHINSTYLSGIPLQYNIIYLKQSWKEPVVELSVVEVSEEVVVAHKFSIEMVSLIMGC